MATRIRYPHSTNGIHASPALLSINGRARQRKKWKKYGRLSVAGMMKKWILANELLATFTSCQQRGDSLRVRVVCENVEAIAFALSYPGKIGNVEQAFFCPALQGCQIGRHKGLPFDQQSGGCPASDEDQPICGT